MTVAARVDAGKFVVSLPSYICSLAIKYSSSPLWGTLSVFQYCCEEWTTETVSLATFHSYRVHCCSSCQHYIRCFCALNDSWLSGRCCYAGVYPSSSQGVEAFASDVHSVCHLFRAASRRSNSSFASELVSKGVPAMSDLISIRMDKLLSQHQGLALPDQAPTPGKKLKKRNSSEVSPGASSDPGSSDDKSVNIVEDLARYCRQSLKYT